MVEFMNLRQRGINVQEYSLKFTQLSKYASAMVADPRARMNKFVMGVSSLVEKECRTTILLNDMDISRLMVYVQQIEESKIREIRQDRTRCPTCGKQHLGRCLAGTDDCFACGNRGHNMRDFPNIKSRGKEVNEASLDPNAPKKNPFDGMGARKDN
ncbi:hypothetical protein EJD97_024254 [Solanum chilense]|uniref:Retrotransposon gag domain-containing protein n=1 Tax=Solanum chilense TaxID=4083 RepID=A0A6N2AR96_SOLCI|nr:hypothetical protein EJD97_024254 [Solanum chilense]